jgi:D-threo-aldose 1-dehydrogenase
MINLSAHRQLGATQLKLGPLGIGTGPLGNLYTAVNDADADATLETAEVHGIRWFDTAPLYGLGLAEHRLGRYLRRAPEPQRVISTKVGRILQPTGIPQIHPQFASPLPYRPVFNYSPRGIERSYEQSLTRLALDRVELLLLHDVDRLSHPVGHRALVQQILGESLPTLHRMKREGRIDAIGLGINEWDIGYEVLSSAAIDCVLLAGRFTLLDHTAHSSGFLDSCARKRVPVLAGGIFNSGFLAGGSHFDYLPATEDLLRRRARLSAICTQYGVALPALALQFTAAHPAITSVVVGARSAEEINALLKWSAAPIPQTLWDRLREEMTH